MQRFLLIVFVFVTAQLSAQKICNGARARVDATDLRKMNGVLVSVLSEEVDTMNGLSVSALMGLYGTHRGVELGLFNDNFRFSGFGFSAINFACDAQASGVMISPINTDMGTLNGVAISLISTCDTLHGVQIGGWCTGFTGSGVQIGLLNMAEDGNRVQLGLINVIESNPRWCRVLPLVNIHRAKK